MNSCTLLLVLFRVSTSKSHAIQPAPTPAQEEEELDSEALARRPFQLRQRVSRASGALRVRLRLRLGGDADADKREVVLEPVFRLGPPVAAGEAEAAAASGGKPRAAMRRKVPDEPQTKDFDFPTQVQTY